MNRLEVYNNTLNSITFKRLLFKENLFNDKKNSLPIVWLINRVIAKVLINVSG